MKGIVSNENGEPIEGAEVGVVDRDHPSYTTVRGEYWRLLLPGTYVLNVRIQSCITYI